MKLSNITIKYFEGIQHMSLDLDTPVVLVAGDNNSGKTSLRDAIHFVIQGDSGRVKLKKDYGELVYNGAKPKDAVVNITLDGAEYGRKVATGKATVDLPDFPIIFPYLSGAAQLADQPVTDIQRMLAKIAKVKPTKLKVTEMMQQAGVSDECAAAALPMLSAGFPSAHKAAQSRVAEARGAWQQITGEKYGASKAQSWEYEPPEAPEGESLDELRETLKKVEKKRDKAADEFKDMRREYGVTQDCPECGTKLNYNSESGLTVAGKETDPQEYMGTQKQLRDLTSEAQALGMKIAAAEVANQDAEEITAEALAKHEEIMNWAVLVEALAPTGIPLKLTAEAIAPINKRLVESAETTGWPLVMICNDLSIAYGGRPYGLLSESEMWRCNAMIADALALISGVKFFVLDRMDVLSPRNRGICLKWLQKIGHDHDRILVIATLKAPPAKLPPLFSFAWIENGMLAVTEDE